MFNFILPRFLFKVEKWKWNKEYRVYVSNMGHFKNEYKQDLPIKIDNKGYCKINTINCGWVSVHRLVMFTWRPIPNAGNLTVDHLDHNKRNNALDNLEWVTYEENQVRAKSDLLCGGVAKSSPTATKSPTPAAASYKAGKKLHFATLEEAAEWCMSQSGPGLTKEQAMKMIETKCASGAKYCGRKWKKVN